MRRAASVALLLLAFLPLAACAGNPIRPHVTDEVSFWRADFAVDRDELLRAIESWDRCGDDRPACQEALFRVEVGAAVLSRIDSPSHPRIADDALLPPAPCLRDADLMARAATSDISQGARAGWDAYETGSLSEIAVAQTEISHGRNELYAASQLVDAAPC